MLSMLQRDECIERVHWDANPKGLKHGDDFSENKPIRNHVEKRLILCSVSNAKEIKSEDKP
jgi:hypothetical protein